MCLEKMNEGSRRPLGTRLTPRSPLVLTPRSPLVPIPRPLSPSLARCAPPVALCRRNNSRERWSRKHTHKHIIRASHKRTYGVPFPARFSSPTRLLPALSLRGQGRGREGGGGSHERAGCVGATDRPLIGVLLPTSLSGPRRDAADAFG